MNDRCNPFLLSRRSLLAIAAAQCCVGSSLAQDSTANPTIGFGFGTYGMKALPTEVALRKCAAIGYDGIELALMKGWQTEPTLLNQRDRAVLRKQLVDLDLSVPSLLESLPCLRSDEQHQQSLEKLKRATELAHDIAPEHPPVVQSIVAGKTSQWESSKHRLVKQLADWAEIGRASRTVVCFKPHAAHLVHTPDRALWIHRQVASEWLKVVYDYSHFSLENLSIDTSLRQLLPITAYVQVKDSRGTPTEHDYLLPGDGKTDYTNLLSILKEARYSGFVNVEVSSHIHRKPEYDPIHTAKLCYERLAPIFERLDIRR